MKVRRAIYRGTDGSYIYSTTDMGINPYHESGFVMKFVDHCVEIASEIAMKGFRE